MEELTIKQTWLDLSYTFLHATLAGAVHGSGAELVDINGSRIDNSFYAWAALLHYVRTVKAVFFIDEEFILNKDTELFPVRMQQTCVKLLLLLCNISMEARFRHWIKKKEEKVTATISLAILTFFLSIVRYKQLQNTDMFSE